MNTETSFATAPDIARRNNVRIKGQGKRTMLFAHGFGCDQNMWRLVTPAFEATHRVVLFDYVGAGDSDKTAYDAARYSTLAGYARDVLEICDALALEDVCFVGHSVSAMIGMLAAIEEPHRFAQLIMVAPSPCYVNEPGYVGGFERNDLVDLLDMMDNNGMNWANFLAATAMQNPDRPELAQELEGSFCKTDPIIVRQFAEATFFSDHRADLARCTTPSLILQCTNDAIAPLGIGDYMHGRLPSSELMVMEATGHCPHVSHPAETISKMKAYIGL